MLNNSHLHSNNIRHNNKAIRTPNIKDNPQIKCQFNSNNHRLFQLHNIPHILKPQVCFFFIKERVLFLQSPFLASSSKVLPPISPHYSQPSANSSQATAAGLQPQQQQAPSNTMMGPSSGAWPPPQGPYGGGVAPSSHPPHHQMYYGNAQVPAGQPSSAAAAYQSQQAHHQHQQLQHEFMECERQIQFYCQQPQRTQEIMQKVEQLQVLSTQN